MVEFSPATREARVRFPASAISKHFAGFFSRFLVLKCGQSTQTLVVTNIDSYHLPKTGPLQTS